MSQPSDPAPQDSGADAEQPTPGSEATSAADAASGPQQAMPSAAKATLDKKKTIIGAVVTLVVLGLVFWALAKRFGVTPGAARKWLLGIGMPELDMAVQIAQAAHVNVLWLLQGAGPKRGEAFDTEPGELLDAVQQLPDDDGQQVFDFIRYKIERADGWFASEKLAHYMVMLDRFAAKKAPGKE